MSQTAVLHKLLHVREQEKTNAEVKKRQAREIFEEIATRLYQQLKTKEKAESDFEEVMQTNMTITKMKEQSLYISRLNGQIAALEQQVQQARNDMEQKQTMLTEAYVELKKVEKLIELREEEQETAQKKAENQLMDELSIRQYLNAN